MDTKTVELTMVRIKDVQDFESFEKNDYGILEPSLESIPNRENGNFIKILLKLKSIGCKS